MMTTERRNIHATLTSSFLTVIFLVLLGGIEQAQAQWTTPDGSGNTHTTNSGNVGIGTGSTAPTQKLEVQIPNAAGDGIKVTDAGASGKYLYMGDGSSTSGQFGSYILGDSNAPWGLLLEGKVPTDSTSIPAVSVRGNIGWSALANSPIFTVATTSGGELFRVGATGNVGIGTASPSVRLHIAGDNFSTLPALKLQNDQTNGHSWWLYSGATGAAGAFGIYDEFKNAYRMFFDGEGNTGIGTTSPNQALTINGYASAGFGTTMQVVGPTSSGVSQNQLNITSAANTWGLILGQNNSGVASSLYHCANCAHIVNTNNAALVFGTNNTDRMRIDGSGNVGIGPSGTLPGYKLDVRGGQINASGGFCMAGDCRATWAEVTGSLQWSGSANGINYNSGNVGIGIAPTSSDKLTVNGSTKVTGNINATGDIIADGNISAKYQDVAEWVPATHTLSAGTVVILNPTKSNEVMASISAYDTHVAGVVSAQPGISLGEAGIDKALVATTGRVKVMVDATKSPIHVGDLLVTSDEEGVAMKSEPVDLGGVKLHRPGTLIGKALEPLESGQGKILVLLSLQ